MPVSKTSMRENRQKKWGIYGEMKREKREGNIDVVGIYIYIYGYIYIG